MPQRKRRRARSNDKRRARKPKRARPSSPAGVSPSTAAQPPPHAMAAVSSSTSPGEDLRAAAVQLLLRTAAEAKANPEAEGAAPTQGPEADDVVMCPAADAADGDDDSLVTRVFEAAHLYLNIKLPVQTVPPPPPPPLQTVGSPRCSISTHSAGFPWSSCCGRGRTTGRARARGR